MKQIYIANVSSSYRSDYTLAFQNRNDAVKSVCACHDCTAEEAKSYIKVLPFVADPPMKVDLAEVDSVIDIAIRATAQALQHFESETKVVPCD